MPEHLELEAVVIERSKMDVHPVFRPGPDVACIDQHLGELIIETHRDIDKELRARKHVPAIRRLADLGRAGLFRRQHRQSRTGTVLLHQNLTF